MCGFSLLFDPCKQFRNEVWISNFNNLKCPRSVDLKVRKLRVDEYPQVSRLMEIWERVSDEKKVLARDSLDKQKFSDCACIAACLKRDTFKDTSSVRSVSYDHIAKSKPTILSEVIVCENLKDSSIQGIMSYNINFTSKIFFIEYLMTNPDNIISSNNKFDLTKIRGVGTRLLDEAVAIAYENGLSQISLYSLRTANDFYRNYGFVYQIGGFGNWILNITEVMMKKNAASESTFVA